MTGDRKTFTGYSGYLMPKTQRQLLEKADITDVFVRNKALSELIVLYWKPIYCHIRRKWPAISDETAKDLTQDFWTRCTQKVMARKNNVFSQYKKTGKKFRTYLLCSIDNFVISYLKKINARIRSPQKRILSIEELDYEIPDLDSFSQSQFEAVTQASDIEYFNTDSEMIGTCLLALDALAAWAKLKNKKTHYELFLVCIIEPSLSGAKRPAYVDLANKYGIVEKQVSNMLITARRTYQKLLREQVYKSGYSSEEVAGIMRKISKLTLGCFST